MDKKEMIKSYILAKDITDEEKKERFEIARDIYIHLPEIMFELKREFIGRVKGYIEEDEDIRRKFEIAEQGLLDGEKHGKIRIFKPAWKAKVNDNIPILSYLLEADIAGIRDLALGIAKADDDKGIPFKGNWQKIDEPAELKQLSGEIFYSVSKKTKNVEPWWPVYFCLDPPYGIKSDQELEFFFKILTKNGIEEAARYVRDEISRLIDDTEELVDEFIRVYNENYA